MSFQKKNVIYDILFFLGMIKIYQITSYDYRYIPYTNYFEYIGNHPAYSYQ